MKAKYEPNGGRYLQILSGKDFYNQTIVVSSDDTFPVRHSTIFVNYPLGKMREGNELWTNLEFGTFKIMTNSAELCCGLRIKYLRS